MAQIHASAERTMPLPAALIYRCLADYAAHHPRFLPPAFRDYAVEAGGYGAGTIITFTTRMAGQTRFFRGVVAEPEPGRVLEERYPDLDSATTFTVTPDGEGCRVRIDTWLAGGDGPRGWLEARLAPPLLRRLFADELRRLEMYAASLVRAGLD
jgi:polyketide cyclase/dehydrase/lipid transport protein